MEIRVVSIAIIVFQFLFIITSFRNCFFVQITHLWDHFINKNQFSHMCSMFLLFLLYLWNVTFLKLISHYKFFSKQLLLLKEFIYGKTLNYFSFKKYLKVTKNMFDMPQHRNATQSLGLGQIKKFPSRNPQLLHLVLDWMSEILDFDIGKSIHSPQTNSKSQSSLAFLTNIPPAKPNHTWHNLRTLPHNPPKKITCIDILHT